MSRSNGKTRRVSRVNARRELSIFAWSILLLPLFLSFASPLFQLPEFAPPQVIYSKDLVPLLLAPWATPSSWSRALSRLIQAALLSLCPKESIFPCYLLWIAVGLTRTLVGFLLSRSVGWAYPRLFNHWALYESSGGCGPPLVIYLFASGARPDFNVLLTHLRGYRWEVTESLVVLVACTLVAGLDRAPWTYGVAIGLALLVTTCRAVLAAYYPPETIYSLVHLGTDLHPVSSPKRLRADDVQIALLLLAFIPLPSIIPAVLSSTPILQMPSPSNDGAPFLEIIVLSYPRPNDSPSSPAENSILSQTIASYLPYVSSSTSLSVFTHARPLTHPSFTHAQQRFKNAPVTFYADDDTHPDMYEGQYLHLTEAFRWTLERGARTAQWVMLVEDDFPLCGDRGWQGVLRVMQELDRGQSTPPKPSRFWGGFVGTGGSGLIVHQTLLPILAHTLRLHASVSSPFPASVARRPADIVIQDCLLGADPLCPGALSSKEAAEGIWFANRQPSMVITSRLVMDHVGGNASTAKGRVYDSNKWRCGWRHPFHGRPEVMVVPVPWTL